MKRPKKILSTAFKVLIGVTSFVIIYMRLLNDFTPERMTVIGESLASAGSKAAVLLALLLIPVNWGIESRKWQLITAPVERVNYGTATRSVYSGVFLGNLAPGRATEFLARVIYFRSPNRAKVTLLHFLGGMFQLSITVLAGCVGMLAHAGDFMWSGGWLPYALSSTGILFLLALSLAIYRFDAVLGFLNRQLSRHNSAVFRYPLSRRLILQLFSYSLVRYAVFYSQFALLLHIFAPFGLSAGVLAGIALYFLVTSLVPMIGVIEPAVRAAVALVIFNNSGIGDAALALTSVLLWLVNIVVPSVIGYYFLLGQNFNFKLFRTGR